MIAAVHSHASCDTPQLGDQTQIDAFARIEGDARIGSNCKIGAHSYVAGDVVIGDRVTLADHVSIGNAVRIEDDVTVGSQTSFAVVDSSSAKRTIVRSGVHIGAHVTILDGVEIGPNAVIDSGTLVRDSVPAEAIVSGNPPQIIGYVDTPESVIESSSGSDVSTSTASGSWRPADPLARVSGVQLQRSPVITDMRGSITVNEISTTLPFVPQRYFMVFDVPGEETRGQHAHRECHQFLVCTQGRVLVLADDGTNRESFVLDNRSSGLYLPPMTWGVQYGYTRDSVLLVLASHPYEDADYIRTYDEFLQAVKDNSSQ